MADYCAYPGCDANPLFVQYVNDEPHCFEHADRAQGVDQR